MAAAEQIRIELSKGSSEIVTKAAQAAGMTPEQFIMMATDITVQMGEHFFKSPSRPIMMTAKQWRAYIYEYL